MRVEEMPGGVRVVAPRKLRVVEVFVLVVLLVGPWAAWSLKRMEGKSPWMYTALVAVFAGLVAAGILDSWLRREIVELTAESLAWQREKRVEALRRELVSARLVKLAGWPSRRVVELVVQDASEDEEEDDGGRTYDYHLFERAPRADQQRLAAWLHDWRLTGALPNVMDASQRRDR